MRLIRLASPTDFAGWRAAARDLRQQRVPPEEVRFVVGDAPEGDLFQPAQPPADAGPARPFTVPREFVDVAQDVALHRTDDRYDLLYRLLWRLEQRPDLMKVITDPDVADALERKKNVAKAVHKMHAFVRFRKVETGETSVSDPSGDNPETPAPETYVAWFEPAHYVTEKATPFFARRFANMRFSILTPDACAHWDGSDLTFTPGADRSQAPEQDELEEFWRTYYASIFNPARLKTQMMQKEMPKRYWRNLPEAELIPDLVRQSQERTAAMVAAAPTLPDRKLPAAPEKQAARSAARAAARVVAETAGGPPLGEAQPPHTLEGIAEALQTCRRCDLWKNATQGVPGEGPAEARLLFVGEQPGDQEDLAGRPFVGPAGQVFNRALAAAGVPREHTRVTNAVKHFKHELRGKRRMHKTPDTGEVSACRWWLDAERAIIRPRVVVALGGTAANAVFGKPMPVMKSRGQAIQLPDQSQGFITVHPSFLLRLPDEAAKAEQFDRFVADLGEAWKLAA